MKDIFICHASEDKTNVVRPLVEKLKVEGISFWVDEAEIHWGDSITQKVNDGIRTSKYVIVVLSDSFLQKNWPKRELDAVLNIEASSGEVKVLPLVYGDSQLILEHYPLLNDKMYLSWENGVHSIIEHLKRKLGMSDFQPETSVPLNISVPKIKKAITQRDKDLFLKKTYKAITDYFVQASKQTEEHYPQIQFETEEIDSRKFICKVYNNGDIINACYIRIGAIFSDSSIGYSEGRFLNTDDNSFNEVINVNELDGKLSLGFTMGMHFVTDENKKYSEFEAAENLWKRFTSPLEQL